MKFASIDIGTNTVLLLLAEAEPYLPYNINTIRNYYKMPRIGKGLLPGGNVTDSRKRVLAGILEEYSKIILENNCEKLLINATNAFRIAGNRQELIDLVHYKTGRYPKVITGAEEAELSFLGAVSPLLTDEKIGAVIDIGGGSTEISIGTQSELFYSHSFNFGVVSLSEKYFANNPPVITQIEALKAEVSVSFLAIPPHPISLLVGVAGTPTSLSAIAQNLEIYSDEKIEGYNLDLSSINNLYEIFRKTSSDDLLKMYPEILAGRDDLIFAGLLILQSALEQFKLSGVSVSSKGLRYGAITKYLLETKNGNQNG